MISLFSHHPSKYYCSDHTPQSLQFLVSGRDSFPWKGKEDIDITNLGYKMFIFILQNKPKKAQLVNSNARSFQSKNIVIHTHTHTQNDFWLMIFFIVAGPC